MLHTVHFNYLNILRFSMIVDADSRDEALKIIKSAIADNNIFTFSHASNIKLGYLQVIDIDSYFSIEPEKVSSRYSYVFEDEDDTPTKPDCPTSILKK